MRRRAHLRGARGRRADRREGRLRPLTYVTLLALAGAALALRAPWLGAVPNPAHDEGNWLLLAHRRFVGEPASLAGDQGFVTTLYARLIALAWRVTGETVAGARSVQVAGVVLGMALSYALCARLRAPRAGVALAALLALHPWCVAWSRVAVAPYALSLVTAVVATLAVAIAWGGARRPLVARVLAGQLLALGFHFSPLALIPALSSAIWIALRRRETLRDRATLLAGGLALAHVAPIALAALRVTAGGSTRPSGHLDHFRERIANYAMTLLDGMSGEATARDFAGVELTGPLGWVIALGTLGVIAWSLRAPQEPAHRELHSLARVQLAVALPGIALLLAPMRQWHLPSVDAERYAFALLAPTMVLLALTAERARGRHVATACALWLALSPTARMGAYFHHGGSPDRGVFRANGGGAQRRWKVSAGRRPVAEEVLLAADALGNGRAVTVVVADYVFHPIHFFNRARPHTVVDASFASVPRRPGAPVLFARWGDGVFARGFAPREMVSANASLTGLMREARFVGLHHLRDLRQPDGTALLELWGATDSP